MNTKIPSRMFAVVYGDETVCYQNAKRAHKAVATAIMFGDGGTGRPLVVEVAVRRLRFRRSLKRA